MFDLVSSPRDVRSWHALSVSQRDQPATLPWTCDAPAIFRQRFSAWQGMIFASHCRSLKALTSCCERVPAAGPLFQVRAVCPQRIPRRFLSR